MTGPPVEATGPVVQPDAGQLQAMNRSAAQNASPVNDGAVACAKTSWFSIRVIDDKDAVVEGLTLKLKLKGAGEVERVTSRATDPVKVEQLDAGGTGEVMAIESEKVVWEAVGDIT